MTSGKNEGFDEIILKEALKEATEDNLCETIIKVGKKHGYKLSFDDVERIIDTIPLVSVCKASQ